MNTIRKFRLIDKNRDTLGYKRIITEYITMHEQKWALDEIKYDDALVVTSLPMGFDNKPRAKLKRTNVRVKK